MPAAVRQSAMWKDKNDGKDDDAVGNLVRDKFSRQHPHCEPLASPRLTRLHSGDDEADGVRSLRTLQVVRWVRTHSQQGAYSVDVNKLLDTCKEVCSASTEVELAGRIGVSKQALSGYRHGTRSPDPVVCATIAGLTGIPLAKVLGIVGEARAISREEKAVWRKLALSACLALCAVGISYNPASARVEPGSGKPAMYIM